MDIVRRLRKSKGWSQEHLAEAANIGRATVQRIESGAVVPSNEIALALAAALGTDAERIRVDSG
jgi:transcriptional regulator with XRE-family HTH domain